MKKKGFKHYVSKLCVTLLISLLIGLNSCNSYTDGSNSEQLILVCGDSKVLLVDYANSRDNIPKIIWSWNAHNASDLPDDFKTKKFNSLDDCKAIKDGEQILVSSSSGAIAILNKEDKKVLFYANVPNAHSIELLPGNKIIAAASTNVNGNKLMLFDINNPGEVLFTDSLYSAHGIVWDENRNSLFALGYDVLREYKFEDKIKLVLNDEWVIPGISGHDLQMAPDGDNLFITEHTGAWIFDIKNEQFNKIGDFPDAENIKSLNQNKHGQYVFTVPEESWWTYHVRFHNPFGILAFPDMRVYKARWYNSKDRTHL